jgi:hypothetical protein
VVRGDTAVEGDWEAERGVFGNDLIEWKGLVRRACRRIALSNLRERDAKQGANDIRLTRTFLRLVYLLL